MTEIPKPMYTTLIFDIGDVILTWSTQTTTCIPSRTLKRMMSGPTWVEYECGRLSQTECYDLLAKEFEFDVSVVDEALQQARESLHPNEELIALVRELKTQCNGQLRVYALSNMSLPDYEYVIKIPTDWSIFDRMFPTALLGERKPALAPYEKMVAETGIDPRTAVFVDDKLVNVEVAQSLGMHGIVFDEQERAFETLRSIFGSRVDGDERRPRRMTQSNQL